MFFFQCTTPTCALRFPADADDPRAATCPRCQSPAQLQEPAVRAAKPTAPPLPPLFHLELVLDNLRSIYNVGSIFRTADGLGAAHLHLCGITATPEHPKLHKTALGAAAGVPWTSWPNGVQVVEHLRERGFTVWALETTPDAVWLSDLVPPKAGGRLALVAGSEVAGVDPAVLTRCHQVAALPMRGVKSSLNVTVALGAAVYFLQQATFSHAKPAIDAING